MLDKVRVLKYKVRVLEHKVRVLEDKVRVLEHKVRCSKINQDLNALRRIETLRIN